MGMFTNYIPRANLPVARESSHLLSPREAGQRGQLWKDVRDNTERAVKLTNGLGAAQRAIEMIHRRDHGFSTFHPFKVYPPSNYWPNSNSGFVLTPDTVFRTFRVRNGVVLTTNVEGLNIEGSDQVGVKGTDLVDYPYDEQFLYKADQMTAILNVPEYVVYNDTSLWQFWVEVYTVSSVQYAVLRYGAAPDDPPAMDYSDPHGLNPSWHSTNPWTTYPAPDGTHFIVASIDTATVKGQALIRQWQTTDILSSGTGGGVVCPFG